MCFSKLNTKSKGAAFKSKGGAFFKLSSGKGDPQLQTWLNFHCPNLYPQNCIKTVAQVYPQRSQRSFSACLSRLRSWRIFCFSLYALIFTFRVTQLTHLSSGLRPSKGPHFSLCLLSARLFWCNCPSSFISAANLAWNFRSALMWLSERPAA